MRVYAKCIYGQEESCTVPELDERVVSCRFIELGA
jgi:hypothetical protein